MIAAVYLRKSTVQAGIADSEKSVARQLDQARGFAAAKGWTIDESAIYTDDGISGAEDTRRPGFVALLAAVERGPSFQVLLIADVSRLSRDNRKLANYVSMIDEAGVKLWTVEDGSPVNIDSATDVFMVQAKGLGGALHNEQARQKTTIALTMKAKQGDVAGGLVFGYSNVRIDGRVRRVIHAEQAAIVRTIFERYAAGSGLKQIAHELNAAGSPSPRAQQGRPSGWSPSTIRAILHRELYRGEIVWGKTQKRDKRGKRYQGGQKPRPSSSWIRLPAPELRLVEPGVVAAVDARIEKEMGKYLRGDGGKLLAGRPARHATHLLAGLAKCSECGGGMEAIVRFGDKSRTKSYVCASNKRKGATVCSNNQPIAVAVADSAVLRVVEQAISAERLTAIVHRAAELHREQEGQTATLAAVRATLDKEVRNLTAAIAAGGDLDSLVTSLKAKEQRRQAVERELQARSTAFDAAKLRQSLTKHAADWKSMLRRQTTAARQILQRLVAGRFIFTPDPAGGYTFAAAGDLGGLVHQMASLTFASWNQLVGWLRRLDGLREAA